MQLSMPISEHAILLENQCKPALLEEEKKKEEQAEEAKRVEQRTSKCLHKQLAEQAQLETVQLAEQETARQLISEASRSCLKQSKEQGTIYKVQRLHRLCYKYGQ